MSAYLDIAEHVLRVVRRPMSAQAILETAFRNGFVPPELYGRSQHKTLQARLSEDILTFGLESRFFRTNPGLFFLSELRSDTSIPDEYKDPFHARRRLRDLRKTSALAIECTYVENAKKRGITDWQDFILDASRLGALKHADTRHPASGLLFVWAFSVVRRAHEVLCYNVGKYRDVRETFLNKKSVGFCEVVGYENQSLFSNDAGVTECGLNTVLSDLDLSRSAFKANDAPQLPVMSAVDIVENGRDNERAIIFIMEWECPKWFEPTTRRLSLNNVRWIDARRPPNDLHEFDPWSVKALQYILKREHHGPDAQSF